MGRHSAFPVASLASPGTYSQSAIYHRLLPFADSTTTITTDWQGYIRDNSLEYNRDLDENNSGIYFLYSNSNAGLIKSSTSIVVGSPVFSATPALPNTDFNESTIIRPPQNDDSDASKTAYVDIDGISYPLYFYQKLSHDFSEKSFGIYWLFFYDFINLTDFKPKWASTGVNYYVILQGDADISDYENIKNFNIYYTLTPITEDYTKTYSLQNATGDTITINIYGFTQEDNNQEKHGVLMCNYMSLHDIKIPEV
ncbi:hypothetical protein SDC9_128051 [bioreactor metagenome]|uniref:Uncharacterized protein n=1 Tax=bioreactor metagenome TaxID=1076179 RepID=A0A645CV14_9ZZZZ